MDQLFMNLEKLTSVPGGGSFLHIVTENGDKIIKAEDFARDMFNFLTGGEPEAHNQIYRGGKVLTDFYSYDEIIEMVQAKDFSDILLWRLKIDNAYCVPDEYLVSYNYGDN